MAKIRDSVSGSVSVEAAVVVATTFQRVTSSAAAAARVGSGCASIAVISRAPARPGRWSMNMMRPPG